MKKGIGLFIISVSVFMFILSGCSSKQEDNVKNFELNNVMEKAISIQYGNKDIMKTEVFTKNYLDKISDDQNFYKEQLNPYKIVESNVEDVKSSSDGNLVINVRVNDKNGGYFQVIHMIKTDGRYYVDNIEYDI